MRVAPISFPTMPAKQYHTTRYDQFLGVDFSTDPAMIDGRRSPNAVNLISDAGGYPEKRVGWEILQSKRGERVNGLFHFVDSAGQAHFLAHCGTDLYDWTDIEAGSGEKRFEDMADAKSTACAHAGKLYILDGEHYRVFDGTTLTQVEANAYVPTTVIGRAPTGGGTPLEAVNLLSPWRKNSFVGDGGAKEVVQLQIYNGATANANLTVTLNGVGTAIAVASGDNAMTVATKIAAAAFSGWSKVQVGDAVTFTKNTVGTNSPANVTPGSTGVLAGIVTLTPGEAAATTLQLDAKPIDPGTTVYMAVDGGAANPVTLTAQQRTDGVVPYSGVMPDGNGVDNIVVTFSKTTAGYADRIRKCTVAAWFGMGNDSRLFVCGNPDFQNWDFQSGLYDPTYFPDTGYTKVGADSSAIMGYLKQFSTLLIIKEDNEQDATIYQRTAEIDGNGVAYFPLKQGVAGIGAVSKYAFGTLRDDPLFLAKEGVYATSTAYGGVDQQKITQGRSFLVNARLTREENLDTAVAAVWNGLYLLAVNGRCYVADGRKKTGKRSDEGFGYEWFYWTNIPARVFLERGGELFFGDVDGRICRFKSYMDANTKFRDGNTHDAGGVVNDDDGVAVVASWTSKLDDDGDFMLYKSLPYKGTGVLVKPYTRSSISVYVRTDDDVGRESRSADMDIFEWGNVDFAQFSFNTNDAPYVIPLNTRVKRYKSIQVTLENRQLDQGFGCFGIVRRFAVGNYVK